MRGRTLLALACVLALVVVAPGAAVAKRGGSDRPMKGRGSGTTTFDTASTPFPATGQGTARFTHLGKSTYSLNYTITPTGPTTFTVAGTDTIRAANGATLVATFSGSGQDTGPTTSVATAVLTFTGGTGRFAHASGTATATVTTAITSVVGTTVTAHQTFTVRGKISY